MNDRSSSRIARLGRAVAPVAAQLLVLVAIVGVGVVAYNAGARRAGSGGVVTAATLQTDAGATTWTCSMHPEIRRSEPGHCPVCGMELVPERQPGVGAAGAATAPPPLPPAAPKLLGYACAMNCVPPLPEPGKCPICGMEMVAVHDDHHGRHPGGAVPSPDALTLSPEAAALAAIRTAPVARRWVEHEVRMVGFVDYDETRLARLTAYVGGRLDRVFVDYTGIRVRQGDHMVSIYSPELLTAQEELLLAHRMMRERGEEEEEGAAASGLGSWRSSRRTFEAVRERLRLWGMDPAQVEELLERGTVQDHLTLNAPLGGVVIERMVKEGDYVSVGDPLFSIADLGHVWIKLRAYESDLPWLRFGQDVAFTVESMPGREFHGRIAFLSPMLDVATRTVDVRVNVENADGALKPGMYVRARVRTRLASRGRVLEPDLAGKWISPMHPEIIKEGPGACDVCGMALVPAEEFGFVASVEDRAPLVVPSSAPLITGERTLVYVSVGEAGAPAFEAREVVLGPRAGDWYLVAEGLEEGEEVVVRGAFRLDASLQIRGRPSLMNPRGERTMMRGHDHGGGAMGGAEGAPGGDADGAKGDGAIDAGGGLGGWGESSRGGVGVDASPAYRAAAGEALARYLDVAAALAADDLAGATEAATTFHRMARALASVASAEGGATAGEAAAGDAAGDHHAAMLGEAVALRRAASLSEARTVFAALSRDVLAWRDRFDARTADGAVARIRCPMAFDDAGASWLQREGAVANPYFGASMLRCGVVESTWPAATPPAATSPAATPSDGHGAAHR